MAKVRRRIPKSTEGELLFKTDMKCCVCSDKRGDHIHHLDENPSNNNLDNLAFLCFDHHEEASVKNNLRKKLTPETIRKYRELHYDVVQNNRNRKLAKFDVIIDSLTQEELLSISLSSSIILKIDETWDQYNNFLGDVEGRIATLGNLIKYSEHTNPRLAYSMFQMLNSVANTARRGMSYNEGIEILSLILHYFPYIEKDQKEKGKELVTQCISIGGHLVYDAFIYCNNYKLAEEGLLILKFVHNKSKKYNLEMEIQVLEEFDNLLNQINRPERPELQTGLEIIKKHKEVINSDGLMRPFYGKEIHEQLKTWIPRLG